MRKAHSPTRAHSPIATATRTTRSTSSLVDSPTRTTGAAGYRRPSSPIRSTATTAARGPTAVMPDTVGRLPSTSLASKATDASQQLYKVGDVVVYAMQDRKNAEPATVRFAGDLGSQPNVVGLEFFNDGCGKHDGLGPSGVRGFSCPPGRGLYVAANNPRLKGAGTAQAQMPEILAAMGTHLEERVESNVLRHKAELDRATGILLAHAPMRTPVWVRRWNANQGRYLYYDKTKPGSLGSLEPPEGAKVDPEAQGGPEQRRASIDPTYQGPHLAEINEGKISEAEVAAVFEHVANNPDTPLHPDYLLPLVWCAADLFEAEPSLVRIKIPSGGKVNTLGDTHGHLKDVIHVFRKYGCPSATNVYLINGDISDRGDTPDRGGQQGVTIWTLVLCYKVLCPGSLYFTRGNHEDWYNNSPEGPYGAGSFHAEVHRKYPKGKDAHLLKIAFRELFYSLPIAHVVGGKALVVHGGLWRAGYEISLQRRRAKPVELSEVEKVPRRRDIPCTVDRRADMILVDACWNDPHDGRGLLANPRGGNTLLFGGDITAQMCTNEGLSMIVRSHDWPRTNPPHGYEWFQHGHGARLPKLAGQQSICLSVFTASDYCGGTGNRGACAVFSGPDGKANAVTLFEWTADEAMFTWKGAQHLMGTCFLQSRQTATFQDSLWDLKGLVVEFKNELFAEFQAEDATRDSHLPAHLWVQVCERILGDMPWQSLIGTDPAKCIAWQTATDPPMINYMEFLSRYQIRFRNTMGRHAGFRREIASRMYEALLLDDQPIRNTIASIDPSGDGCVSVEELQSVLSRVISCVTPEQSWTMLRTTVKSDRKDGKVSVWEFLSSFQVRFASTYAKPAPEGASWIPGALPQIGLDILREQSRANGSKCKFSELLTKYFVAKDANNNGYLEYDELAAALWALPCCKDLNRDSMQALVEYCDAVGNGRINYLEFLNAFSVHSDHSMGECMQEDNLEGIYRSLYFNLKGVVAQLLEQHIVHGEQRCTPQEFVQALTAANAEKHLLTNDQISVLADTLTVDEDGCFDFRDYFASFEVIDTALGGSAEEH